jgi:hypothetical protein
LRARRVVARGLRERRKERKPARRLRMGDENLEDN